MIRSHACPVIIKLVSAAALGAAMAFSGCELPQRTSQSGSLTATKTSRDGIGPSKISPEDLQEDVETFADRFVNAFSQATDQLSREQPKNKRVLHIIKLSVASGAYTIAAGPSPTVAMLDMIVQVTLLKHSLNRSLIPRMLGGEAEPLVDVIERYEQQVWKMGEMVLTPEQSEELRGCIDAWLEQNPGQIYVAGVRLSDFTRGRTSTARQPNSVFSLLRIDPFASLDPTTRELEEARLLTERIFFYAQRMPQLLTWRGEQLYYDILATDETKTLLADISTFSATSKQMALSVEELRTLIPDQTAQAVTAFSDALGQQREATVAALDSQQTQASQLIDRVDVAVTNLQAANADVQNTLTQVNEVGGTLNTAATSVAEAGRAWEGTILAVKDTADSFKSDVDPSAPASAPIELADVTEALTQMRDTAVELRLLLQDLTTTTQSDDLNRSVVASLAETRRSMEGLTNYITLRAIIIIAAMLVAAIIYRLISSRVASRPANS